MAKITFETIYKNNPYRKKETLSIEIIHSSNMEIKLKEKYYWNTERNYYCKDTSKNTSELKLEETSIWVE